MDTNMERNLRRVRCELCRRGLLADYNVYDYPDGAEKPVLYSAVKGYFWRDKSMRHGGETLQIAGQIAGNQSYGYHLYAFPDRRGRLGCKATDLIDIDGALYRITALTDLHGAFWKADLEVWPYGISG